MRTHFLKHKKSLKNRIKWEFKRFLYAETVKFGNIPQFRQTVKSDISNYSIREDNDVIPLKKDVDKSTNIPLAKSNDTLKIKIGRAHV